MFARINQRSVWMSSSSSAINPGSSNYCRSGSCCWLVQEEVVVGGKLSDLAMWRSDPRQNIEPATRVVVIAIDPNLGYWCIAIHGSRKLRPLIGNIANISLCSKLYKFRLLM